MRGCTNHCRSCGGHFTSLAAFDAHKPLPRAGCEWPEEAPLVELSGKCEIGDPENPLKRCDLYEHESAGRAREVFGRPSDGMHKAHMGREAA